MVGLELHWNYAVYVGVPIFLGDPFYSGNPSASLVPAAYYSFSRGGHTDEAIPVGVHMAGLEYVSVLPACRAVAIVSYIPVLGDNPCRLSTYLAIAPASI